MKENCPYCNFFIVGISAMNLSAHFLGCLLNSMEIVKEMKKSIAYWNLFGSRL